MLTRWYCSPRDKGGDCHHFSVPSLACWIERFLEATLGSQWSQDNPKISNFPATVANLQNNSGSPTSSPHVAVAVIFFPWAILIAGRLSLCPWPDFGAKLTIIRACRMARAGEFIVETAHSLNNHLTTSRTRRSQVTHMQRANTDFFVCRESKEAQITLGVGWEEFPDFPRSPASKQADTAKRSRQTTKNFHKTCHFAWLLGTLRSLIFFPVLFADTVAF